MLIGKSALKIAAHKSTSDFSIYPSDFHGVFPKLLVKENDKAGIDIFFDKIQRRVKFASPVSEKSQKCPGRTQEGT